MSQQERVPQPCKLCGTIAVLLNSHIVASWVFGRAMQMYSDGGAGPLIAISDGAAVYRSDQWRDYLLCEECERRVKIWEDYVAGITIQLNGQFPALEGLDDIGTYLDTSISVAVATRFNGDLIARFVASVVWRASVSTKFPKVSLGKYEPEFAEYLLGDGELPPSAWLHVDLIDIGKTLPTGLPMVLPQRRRQPISGCARHEFALFGMWFKLFVGGHPDDFIQWLSFAGTKRVLLTDGKDVIANVAKTIRAAQPKGSYARHLASTSKAP